MFGHIRLVTVIGIVTLFLLAAAHSLFAQVSSVPVVMNFQGRLARPDGTPVANGNYNLQFSLYNALTGGTLWWQRSVTNIPVRNGTFATKLDFSGGFQNAATLASVFSASAVYLEIKIGTNAPLSPRQQLVTVAYAMKADRVKDGSITSASILDGTIANADLANNAITSAKIFDGTIAAADIASGAVTSGKIGWPFAYTGSSDNTLFAITNNGIGYGLSGSGGQAGVTGTSDGGFGVLGNSTYQMGVRGESTYSNGVYGASSTEAGVYGYSGFYYGVHGDSPSGWGVYGTSNSNVGVWGYSNASYGVHGRSINNDGVNGYSVNGYGVVGSSDYSYAGYFYGILTATDKRFQIDHPLDPANKYLNHGCIESSERLNVYSGNVVLDSRGKRG